MAVMTIRMTGYDIQPDGTVHVKMEWDGAELVTVFQSEARLAEVAASPIQSADQAMSLLLSYWLTNRAGGSGTIDLALALTRDLEVDFSAQVPINLVQR